MKLARKVSAGVLGIAVMASVIVGAQENFAAPLSVEGYSVEVVQGPEGLQILYILDSSAGRIAVYEFDTARRKLKLCSVTPLERKGTPRKGPGTAAIRAIRKDNIAYVYVIDEKTGKLAVYSHELSGGSLVLLAVRDWAIDMKLDYYNAGPDGKELTTEMIRSSLPRDK